MLVIVSTWAVVYLGLFFFGVFSFPGKFYLPVFRSNWTLNQSFLRFLSVFLTAHVTAVIVTLSFSSPSTYNGSVNQSIAGTLILFLILTLVYAVLIEGVAPHAYRSIDTIGYQTRFARTIKEQAGVAFENRRYREAKGLLTYYRTIDPGNREAAELFGSVTRAMSDELTDTEEEPIESAPRARTPELSTLELTNLAFKYLEDEDPFSAYYYAELAKESASVSGERWIEADRVSAAAAEAIDALELSAAELSAAERYATKQRGIEAISSADPMRNLEGYYIFKRLSELAPADPEVSRYLAAATDAVTDITFFLDDARQIVPLPGDRNIVFLNSPEDAEVFEIVRIGKLVRFETRTYCQEIEVIAVDQTGELAWWFTAPFGELAEGVMLLRGIDRQDQKISTAPQFKSIQAGLDPGEINPSVLTIRPSEGELASLAATDPGYQSIGFFQMLDLTNSLPALGFDPTPVRVAALNRLSSPFTFFVLSLLAFAIGIRLAPGRRGPGIAGFLVLPMLPVVIYGLIELYEYAIHLCNLALVGWVGFSLAMVLVLAVQLIVLVLALILLASSHARLRDG